MLFLVPFLLVWGVSAEVTLSGAQLQQLSQRFVSTIRETQVDRQLTSEPRVQACLDQHRITAGMSDTQIREKREAAQVCFRGVFANTSEADLQRLSEQMRLESSGLVSGRSRQAIMDYFSNRLENALYGQAGANGQEAKLRDQNIVDHKVFEDLYRSQLGKNILLEISRFCLEKASAKLNDSFPDPGTANHMSGWQFFITNTKTNAGFCDPKNSKECLEWLTDTKAITPQDDPYQAVQDALMGVEPQNQQAFLTDFFSNCALMVNPMCEAKAYCEAPAADRDRLYPHFRGFSERCTENGKKYGAEACITQAKLRAMRVNLTALEETKTAYREMQAGPAGLNREPIGSGRVYTGSQGSTIDELTSLTTTEAKRAQDSAGIEAEAFESANCIEMPENAACRDFFYTQQEGTALANVGLRDMAATELERRRIEALRGEDLEKYLRDKGYADLLQQLQNGTPATDIVELAKNRYTAEREAAFSAMEDAFKERQIGAGENTAAQAAQKVQQQLQERNNAFNRLVLFNNVVSSYLKLNDGTQNTATLTREVESMRSGEAPETALQFFSNLSDASGGGNRSGESVTVDFDTLDKLLGGQENPGGSGTTPPGLQ